MFMHPNYYVFDRENKGYIWRTMDVSGDDNTVRILPPLTTSRMRQQRISCQPIRDWQTKGTAMDY